MNYQFIVYSEINEKRISLQGKLSYRKIFRITYFTDIVNSSHLDQTVTLIQELVTDNKIIPVGTEE